MLLHWSPTSPYVRKVMAVAIIRGLDGRIEQVPTNPHLSPESLLAHNPLSRVPCLVPDDGPPLYDSPVICEYLDSLGDAPALFPAAGPARWAALRLQALGDGILDAAVPRRASAALPQDEGRQAFEARQQAAMRRGVDALEAEAGSLGPLATIGDIAAACALGYLDFRFAHEPWRDSHPRLAAWLDSVAPLPPLARTAPQG
ncbi:glutathione S-transferase N-terminal domain-containing protein [Roseomonas sp. NAR14]|uniref:Glutathione S-transferase N-terminal domain-containing protein n=1 Tax=Roseomonas acroporae TaxID=2937791 RepID=A0A9X1YDJ3_9PROT|nr:glutathione S-transferase N-terminal domain-containing protein [Roseomonas acroporae]MCK8787822.1 glutathione S-transferase N-terminal domain-containing protein [Roseomonas acroporae]